MTLLSIIVPAFDEAETIEKIIDEVARADTLGWDKEIIIVDDGSSDDTAERARTAIARLRTTTTGFVISQPRNLGKSAAVVSGLLATAGDYVIVQDADLEYDPAEFAILIDPIQRDRADIVMGSRFIGGRPRRVVYLSNAVGNRLMSALFSAISGLRLTDIHCCYMLLPGPVVRAAAPQIKSVRWGFNPEICALIADWREDLRIVEVGISYYGRSKSDGKKIRLRHGVVAVGEILRYNLRARRALPNKPCHGPTVQSGG